MTPVRRAIQEICVRPVLLGTTGHWQPEVVQNVTAMEMPDFVKISQVVYFLSEKF